jgi:hypothetical protein
MVVGQRSADFIDADLAAGKTYYLLVAPGARGAAFSLVPAGGAPDLPRWLRECQLVENTPSTEAWAKQHWSSIQTRKREYLGKWEARPDRPVIPATGPAIKLDGR